MITYKYDKNISIILGESGPWFDDRGCPFVPYVPLLLDLWWLDQLGLAASFGLSNVI